MTIPLSISGEGCLDCGRGFCFFCNECQCCQGNEQQGSDRIVDNSNTNSSGHSILAETRKESNTREETDTRRSVGRPIKSPESVRDEKSTGRKRAALLYPINPNKPCEWQGLSNAGGGKRPIIGCVDGKQQHRHHGPNKDTLENSPGNVHRICDNCHNIWHSQNNKDYDPNIKHNPRPATKEELADRIMKMRYCAD